jgi:hypothetical protein
LNHIFLKNTPKTLILKKKKKKKKKSSQVPGKQDVANYFSKPAAR